MCDDRTSEFLALARSLPQDQLSSPIPSTTAPAATGRYKTPPSSAAAYDDLRAFHKTAADISKDIAATSAMLTELTLLVRQKSLFEEDSSAVNGLVVRIKANIENLNTRLDHAGIVLQQQKRRLNTQAGQEATNLVGQLKEEFVEATAGFKKVLQQRTDTLKETSDRKKLVYGMTSGQEEYVSLDSKPPVYSSAPSSAQFPTLDLTSGMATGESTSSAPQLPRPRTYDTSVLLCVCCCYLCFACVSYFWTCLYSCTLITVILQLALQVTVAVRTIRLDSECAMVMICLPFREACLRLMALPPH